MPSHWDEKDENAGPAGPSRPGGELPRAGLGDRPLDDDQGRARAPRKSSRLRPRPLPRPWAGTVRAPSSERPRWPEFTEYGCFSCHHDLRDQAWRRGPRADGVAQGGSALGNVDLARHVKSCSPRSWPSPTAGSQQRDRSTALPSRWNSPRLSSPDQGRCARCRRGSLEKCLVERGGTAVRRRDDRAIDRPDRQARRRGTTSQAGTRPRSATWPWCRSISHGWL